LFLEMFHTAGVPVTLASDAHRPEDTGRGLDSAIAIAREAGYETRLSYSHRVATEVSL
jgi:histidinol-phosphatase (PHP family)